jgi:hypothetical protein
MYYTKDGKPTFVPQTDEDRFAVWVEKVSDWKLVKVRERVKDRFGKPAFDAWGRPIYKEVEKIVGTGIAKPTAKELAAVYAKPCRYRRAARASRA